MSKASRIHLLSDLATVPGVTADCTLGENDATVCTVLRGAKRASADRAAVEDLWAILGLDADRAKGLDRSAICGEAIQ